MRPVQNWRAILALGILIIAGCHTPIVDETRVRALKIPAPLKFLLTFDDGPSTVSGYNPTASILDQLAANPVQPGIKAVFFVQTRHPDAGGNDAGRALMRRIHAEGHVLGLHTATAGGHIRHTRLPIAELDRSLSDGIGDLRAITGWIPRFLRPPNWDYNEEVLASYRRHNLVMVLDDIKARDGKTWGFHWNPRLRSHVRAELGQALLGVGPGAIPVIDGVLPIVVTMHDTNTATAHNLDGYITALMDAAEAFGAPVARPPFYDRRPAIERALLARYGPSGN